MSRRPGSRPIPLALTALVALFSAVAALAVSNGMDMSHSHDHHRHTHVHLHERPAHATR